MLNSIWKYGGMYILYNCPKTFCHWLLLTSANTVIELEWNVRHLQFFFICMSRPNRGYAIFLSIQQLIILHSKLDSVRPSKYQDHLERLKHLPINIWSATSTFIWLILVVMSPKLPLILNENKNLSKMADIWLLQVKIFQEVSKIWKIC